MLLCFSWMACSSSSNDPTDKKEPEEKPEVVPGANISGEPYDWKATMKPERPYIHEYDKLMMIKISMAHPDKRAAGGTWVDATFDDALAHLRWVDKVTRGLKKILYLTGWQYHGHDTGYPAQFEVSKALKRASDKTALDSYLWLVKEAKALHTTVSVHTNLSDAWGPKLLAPSDYVDEATVPYRESPLWDTYLKKDMLCRDAKGNLIPIYLGCGIVCLAKEWEQGYTQMRIDKITELLQLDKAGTVHVDAFFPYESPYHHITQEDNNKIMRKIFRYWRDKGVDVTAELYNYKRPDPFIGLQPASWWNDLTAEQRAEIPPSLATGGISSTHVKEDVERGFLFGSNQHGEESFWNTTNPSLQQRQARFIKEFCTMTVPFLYLNTHKVEAYDAAKKKVTYSGGLVADYTAKTYVEGGKLIREGNDVFIPATWLTQEIIAFSEKGYQGKTWALPAGWEKVKTVRVAPVTIDGLGKDETLPVTDGKITLSVDGGQMLSVRAD